MKEDHHASRALVGLAGAVVLGGLSFLPRLGQAPSAQVVLLAAAAVFAAWLVWLFREAAAGRRTLGLKPFIRPPHVVQFFCHSSIYAYWALYWAPVADEVPLILSQVVFAYLLDLCLSWTRRRPFYLSVGPIPIVFSTNLFLWFHDDTYGWQYGLIAAAFLSREFIRWKRDGQSIHIFNPSAAGLALASVFILAFGLTDRTWAQDISATMENGPLMFDVMFLTGVVVQSLFGVTLMTVSAASIWCSK